MSIISARLPKNLSPARLQSEGGETHLLELICLDKTPNCLNQ